MGCWSQTFQHYWSIGAILPWTECNAFLKPPRQVRLRSFQNPSCKRNSPETLGSNHLHAARWCLVVCPSHLRWSASPWHWSRHAARVAKPGPIAGPFAKHRWWDRNRTTWASRSQGADQERTARRKPARSKLEAPSSCKKEWSLIGTPFQFQCNLYSCDFYIYIYIYVYHRISI